MPVDTVQSLGSKALGDPLGLFVTFKLDPSTPGTGQGWVYGTVSAEGRSVTSSGPVESCMKCNADASLDRLFGLFPEVNRDRT